jgi:acyl-CoA reductase-like NAD-dependent aldehyde dehydrogenase
VILKVSQQTPRVAGHYAEAFSDAGVPEGVFQYLHASHDDLARLIADPRIRFVSFTGSVAGGAAVQRAASGQFIATNLVDGFIDLTRQYRLGNPLDHQTTLGPMVRAGAAAFVREDSGRRSSLSRLGYQSLTRPKSFHLRLAP